MFLVTLLLQNIEKLNHTQCVSSTQQTKHCKKYNKYYKGPWGLSTRQEMIRLYILSTEVTMTKQEHVILLAVYILYGADQLPRSTLVL